MCGRKKECTLPLQGRVPSFFSFSGEIVSKKKTGSAQNLCKSASRAVLGHFLLSQFSWLACILSQPCFGVAGKRFGFCERRCKNPVNSPV
jgi:hypothetical protein